MAIKEKRERQRAIRQAAIRIETDAAEIARDRRAVHEFIPEFDEGEKWRPQ
jgi:hypothetical protein